MQHRTDTTGDSGRKQSPLWGSAFPCKTLIPSGPPGGDSEESFWNPKIPKCKLLAQGLPCKMHSISTCLWNTVQPNELLLVRWRRRPYILPTWHPLVCLGCRWAWCNEESVFADDRSEPETWLPHLLPVHPWSVYFIFLKLSPLIRLKMPQVAGLQWDYGPAKCFESGS